MSCCSIINRIYNFIYEFEFKSKARREGIKFWKAICIASITKKIKKSGTGDCPLFWL